MSKPIRAGIIVVTAALLLTSCAAPAAEPAAAPTEITLAMSTPPISLDPANAATGTSLNYSAPAYASVLGRDPDGNLTAELADEWGYVGDDNTVFEFSLRDGVEFADGTPITAEDAVASIAYFAAGPGPSAGYWSALTVDAVDDDTVRITSETPNPMIGDLLAPESMSGQLISPAGLADPQALNEASFGAGPYVLDADATVSGDHYVYTPNENYFDQDDITYEKITIQVIANPNSALQALQSGQVDFMVGSPDTAATAASDPNLEITDAPAQWAGLFLLDRDGTVVPALADVRVRQALNYAVDRESIASAIFGDYGSPVDQPAVPGFDGYSEASADTYTFDPDRARELLAEAGYADGFTLPVNYGSFDSDNTKMVQAVQAQLADVGVTLELKDAANFGGWVDDLISRRYAATILSPGQGGGPEFFAAAGAFMPGGIMNVFNVEDPDVSAAFQALTVAPEADRPAAAQAITDVAVGNAITLPVLTSSTILIHDANLNGVAFTPVVGLPTTVLDWTFGD